MGPPGPRGVPGPTGASGLEVVRAVYCEGELTQGGVFAYVATHTVVEYSTGDVWVSCSVYDAKTESARSQFFVADQIGARTHECSTVFDVDSPSGGWWFFAEDSTGSYATYNDVPSQNDGFTAELNDCSEHVYRQP
jgi:hypothetical protein